MKNDWHSAEIRYIRIVIRRIFQILVSFILLGALHQADAQPHTVITGKVVADTLPLADAAVVLNAADTAQAARRTVLTGADGTFRITTTLTKPEVTISYIGYKKFVRRITESDRQVDLGTIRLKPEPIRTDDVTVQARAPMATVRGDTLQFNAAAFKTNPDATSEDLLKKMPGIQVDAQGKLIAQGEEIKKVYVDGKEFFSDQPKTALKNLPAYTVKNVQIYNDKSEKAKFTGVDDGKRVKTVNLVTKNGVSTSTFGRAAAGYGTDNRYEAEAEVHLFRGDQRMTVTARTDNKNNMGGGEQTSRSAGINYNGEFDKKWKVNGNYMFNNYLSDAYSTRQRHYLTQDRNSADTSWNDSRMYAHNLFLSVEWNPDSTNRLAFRPRLSYSTNRGTSSRFEETLLDGVLSNRAESHYANRNRNYNFSTDLSWMHRFRKAGRTVSIFATVGSNDNRTDGYQNSIYGSPDPMNALLLTRDTIRQKNRSLGPSMSVSGSLTYTEPLSKRSNLNVSYDFRYNSNRSDRRGLNWDEAQGDYTRLDTVTTNIFDRSQTNQSVRLGYGFNADQKLYFNASIGYEITGLHDEESFPEQRAGRYSFGALLPQANLTWRPAKEHNFSVGYNRYTQVPSVDQLQEVYDIADPLNVSTGNPNLEQSYTDNLNLFYNYYNAEHSWGVGLGSFASLMTDMVAYHRRFLTESMTIQGITIPEGAQLVSPVNLGTGGSISINGNGYTTIKPIKCNVNVGVRYLYSMTPSIEDNVEYRAQRHGIGANIGLNSNISEKVDFGLNYGVDLNLSRAARGTFERLLSHNLSGRFQINVWKGLVLRGDATWNRQSGSRDTYLQSSVLLNAGVGYKFLKFRQAEIQLTAFDLLNQNRSFWQSTFDTYVQSTRTNVLSRYFMFRFSYTFDSRRKMAEGPVMP